MNMEATVISRGLQSNATTNTVINPLTSRARIKWNLGEIDLSVLMFRCALVSMAVTFFLVPGGLRALHHTGAGWETWSFASFLILPLVAAHFLCCWLPLAFRYFSPGECGEIPAFLIATTALFFQLLIGYGLFAGHFLLSGGVASKARFGTRGPKENIAFLMSNAGDPFRWQVPCERDQSSGGRNKALAETWRREPFVRFRREFDDHCR
jgi:hypothetical protein